MVTFCNLGTFNIYIFDENVLGFCKTFFSGKNIFLWSRKQPELNSLICERDFAYRFFSQRNRKQLRIWEQFVEERLLP